MNQFATVARQARASQPPQTDDSANAAIARLLGGDDLDQPAAEALFAEIVAGRMPEPLMAAAFVALRIKGETADELTGAARALRAAATPFPRPDYLFADSCGTGGDCSG